MRGLGGLLFFLFVFVPGRDGQTCLFVLFKERFELDVMDRLESKFLSRFYIVFEVVDEKDFVWKQIGELRLGLF